MLTARQQVTVLDTVERQLARQPNTETRNRKPMRPNPLAPWELRIGNLRVYYDVDETHGAYSSLSASYAFDITDKIGLEASASVAYATEEFTLGDDGGLHDYAISVSASYAVTEALGIGAFLTYVGNFDEDILPEGPYGLDTTTYGGVGISYAF